MWLLRKTSGLNPIKCILLLLAVLLGVVSHGQNQEFKRQEKVLSAFGATYLMSTIGFHQLWYKNYERSAFHFFNDDNQWLQMDKVGHAYSAYTLSKYSAKVLDWSGFDKNKSTLYASAFSLTFLTTIELMDAHSKRWGFSWGDMIANGSGISLFFLQELLYQKQIVSLKYSYYPSNYRMLRPEVLGENELQAIFKDYNAQTYWASINFNDLFPEVKPSWLNLAVGYSGKGMVNASGTYTSPNGSQIHPQRQYFIGFDLNLEKIETNKKWLKTSLSLLNCLKIPLPTVEFSKQSTPEFHWLYY